MHNFLTWCLQLGLTDYHSIRCYMPPCPAPVFYEEWAGKVMGCNLDAWCKNSLWQEVCCMQDPYDLAEGSRMPAKAWWCPNKFSCGSENIGVVKPVMQSMKGKANECGLVKTEFKLQVQPKLKDQLQAACRLVCWGCEFQLRGSPCKWRQAFGIVTFPWAWQSTWKL